MALLAAPKIELILESVRTRLVAINATLSPDVYHSKVRRVVRGVMPPDDADGYTLMITALERPYTEMTEGGRVTGGNTKGTQYRLLVLGVEAWIDHEYLTDTESIAIAADIEYAVLLDRYQGGHAKNSWWVSTTRQPVQITTPVGHLRVEFNVMFRTVFGEPSTQI